MHTHIMYIYIYIYIMYIYIYIYIYIHTYTEREGYIDISLCVRPLGGVGGDEGDSEHIGLPPRGLPGIRGIMIMMCVRYVYVYRLS